MNYQKLFNYMNDEHKVALVETDMNEIISIVQEMINEDKTNEPQFKTIREWFEELPEPYRSEALENVVYPNSLVEKLSDAVFSGFTWADTKIPTIKWNTFNNKLISENK